VARLTPPPPRRKPQNLKPERANVKALVFDAFGTTRKMRLRTVLACAQRGYARSTRLRLRPREQRTTIRVGGFFFGAPKLGALRRPTNAQKGSLGELGLSSGSSKGKSTTARRLPKRLLRWISPKICGAPGTGWARPLAIDLGYGMTSHTGRPSAIFHQRVQILYRRRQLRQKLSRQKVFFRGGRK